MDIALFILCVVCVIEKIEAYKDTICEETFSHKYRVTWSATNHSALSKPLCIGPSGEFLYRNCTNGYWDAEPECLHVQNEPLLQCPEDFKDSIQLNICYKFTEASEYPPKCPFEDVLPFNSYRDSLAHFILSPQTVWMPVRRSKKLGLLQWVEASDLYGEDFEERETYSYHDNIVGKDCVIYHIHDNYTEAVSCSEKHQAVCAYKKLSELQNQLCQFSDAQCYQSDFTADSKCFCQVSAAHSDVCYPRVEFLKEYQNNIYTKITADDCSFGLERTQQDGFIWSNSKTKINYTYWAVDTVFEEGYIYGVMTRSGWNLNQELLESCILYERERNDPKPMLDLVFSNISNSFVLTITDPQGLKKRDSKFLLFCFTDSGPYLQYRYVSFSFQEEENVATATFEPHKSGPGLYWCEAFRYLDLKPIKSNSVLLRETHNNCDEFLAILRVTYISGTNPLSKDMFMFLQTVLFLKLKTDEYLNNTYVTRIMEILQIDEDKKQILVNVHFTSKNSSHDYDKEYNFVKGQIIHALDTMEPIKMEMLDFLSPDFCMPTTTGNLTWPKTPIKSVAYPNEFCLMNNYNLTTRMCDGDFIRGAHWSIIDEDCQLIQSDTVTYFLLELRKEHSNNITAIKQMSERYNEFGPFDLYLVGDVFDNFVDSSSLDVDAFAEVISNLLEIERRVFIDAQTILNATGRVLHKINQIIEKQKVPVEIKKNNFQLIVSTLKDLSGVAIQQKSVLMKIPNGYDTEDIQQISDLSSAVWLSPQLIEKLDEKSTLIFMVFLKDSFFNEVSSNVKTVSPIFRVIIPGREEPLPGPIKIIQSVEDKVKEACSFWNFPESRWKKDCNGEDSGRFLVCEFRKGNHFAFITGQNSKSDDVTDNLLDIFESGSSASDTILKLRNITERHDEFTSVDVFLVGEILKKVKDDKNIELEAFTDTINNMHLVKRDVLADSQMEKSSTDTILTCIDEILKNHQYTSPTIVKRDNFMVLISDTKESNFTGLVLSNNRQNFQILSGDVDLEEIAAYRNVSSAVVLSKELKSQMEIETKVIVTLFSTDALFNEKKPQTQNVANIFGVILPLLETFEGPISILHYIDSEEDEELCVHWNYNQTSPGYWLNDEGRKNLLSLTHCEFWHTTNFALLLLDSDKFQNKILDWITTINSSLSCFGLACIIFTAIFFRQWRSNSGNQILLNFVFTIILQIGLLYYSSKIKKNYEDYLLCTITGVALHYSVVSQFCWMLVIAILQFKRFVEVLGAPPKHILLKACLCGWILPVLPVAAVYFLDPENYIDGKVGLCYPSGLGLYLGVWLPISLIVVINFVIFIYIIYSVVHRKSECSDVGSKDYLFQWRLAILLFFMMGLTWTFGFLCELDFGVIFAYLFCATATLQGFVMFLFFIVFNGSTRYLYSQAVKRCCCNNY